MSNGFIRLCSMVFCWAAISACHALLSSHMTNKDDDDKLALCHPQTRSRQDLPPLALSSGVSTEGPAPQNLGWPPGWPPLFMFKPALRHVCFNDFFDA